MYEERWEQVFRNYDVKQGSTVRLTFYDGQDITGYVAKKWRGWNFRLTGINGRTLWVQAGAPRSDGEVVRIDVRLRDQVAGPPTY